MSIFESQTSISLELFNSLQRVDKVVWNNSNFTCINEPLPTTTQTPVTSTTSTLTPTTTLATTTVAPTTSIGPPSIPILTVRAPNKIVRIGNSITVELLIENLTPGRSYSIFYTGLLINRPVSYPPPYSNNNGDILLNGEDNLVNSFQASSISKTITVTFYNPTGVKLIDAILDTDGTTIVNRPVTCGKKIQTFAVADTTIPPTTYDQVLTTSNVVDLIMYFEKKILTRFSYDAVTDREVPYYYTSGTKIVKTSSLVIDGVTDFTNIDEFFTIYTLIEKRHSLHRNTPVRLTKTDISSFTIIRNPTTNKVTGITLNFEKEFTDPGFPGNVFSSWKNHLTSTNIDRTKYIEIYYTSDAFYNLTTVNKQNLPLVVHMLGSTNTSNYRYEFSQGSGTDILPANLYKGTDIDTAGYLRPYIDPVALFNEETIDGEYALVTNKAPTVSIATDIVQLPAPALGALPIATENVATITISAANLVPGRYYKLDYTLTGIDVVVYEVMGSYVKPPGTSGYGGSYPYFGALINDLTTPYGSSMGNYPNEGPVATSFDFSIWEQLFKNEALGINNPPPEGFIATGETQTMTFKVINQNGVVACMKGNVKATTGGFAFRCFIQDGTDFINYGHRASASYYINSSDYAVVEMNELTSIPKVSSANIGVHFAWNDAVPRTLTLPICNPTTDLPLGVNYLEDYMFVKSGRPGSGVSNSAVQYDISNFPASGPIYEQTVVGKGWCCEAQLIQSEFIYGIRSIREPSIASTRNGWSVTVTTSCPPGAPPCNN